MTTNTWDGENRLKLVALPSGIIDTFTYNGDGQRVKKQDSAGTTNHIWDEQSVLLESDGAGTIQVVYSLAPSAAGELVSHRRSGQTAYYHFDGYDSTRQISDNDRAITDVYAYDSYGNVIASTGGTVTPFRYLGKIGYYLDVDTQMLYVRNRYLDRSLGRWQSQDPLGARFPDVNVFPYVANNPLRFTDRFGLTPELVAQCGKQLNALLSEPSFSGLVGIRQALKCNVDIFCSESCGAGGDEGPQGNTFIADGRIHICINANTIGLKLADPFEIMVAILIHESIHVLQILRKNRGLCCSTPMVGPPPPAPNLGGLNCEECKRLETEAYEAQCNYLYGNVRDPKSAILRCIDAGLCFSCLHVCQVIVKNPLTGTDMPEGPPNLPPGTWRWKEWKIICKDMPPRIPRTLNPILWYPDPPVYPEPAPK